MRVAVLAGFVVLWSVAAASAANDGLWCYRDFGGPQYTNCSFPNARECLRIAGLVGGVCERNPTAVAPPRKVTKRHRS